MSEDCDWIPGIEEPTTLPISDTTVPRVESFSQSAASQPAYQSSGGALKIVLLGQNGVGKSSLALSLAGQSDRSLSIDSETQACGNDLNMGLGDLQAHTLSLDHPQKIVMLKEKINSRLAETLKLLLEPQ